MTEQAVPSAVAQRINIKFLTNENVKPAEILKRFRAQFGGDRLSRSQVYDWSKSFTEGRTEAGNAKATSSAGKFTARYFGNLKASYSSTF
jgi:hypothetical protein